MMNPSNRLRVRRTITNSIERCILSLLPLFVAFISMRPFHDPSWAQIVECLAVVAGVSLICTYAYQFGVPASVTFDDAGIVFKGSRYRLDQVSTVAITPKLNLTIVRKDIGDSLYIKPYHRSQIRKDEIQAWCLQHGIAFRHMGHSKAWWSH